MNKDELNVDERADAKADAKDARKFERAKQGEAIGKREESGAEKVHKWAKRVERFRPRGWPLTRNRSRR